MKYFTFFRELNKFDDILKDTTVKKAIRIKILFYNHLIIGIEDTDRKIDSYINLKFGDSIANNVIKDFSPIIGVDYIPKNIPFK